jgi:malonate transporter MadM subunit
MEMIETILVKNGLVFAFLVAGLLMYASYLVSLKFTRGKIPGAAIAITAGLMLAMLGDKKGIADIPAFSGMAFLGSSMLRDFTIVATALGASFVEIRKNGVAGFLSLMLGLVVAFFTGGMIGYAMGFCDAVSFTTIGAGACTFIVGPITGSALGASSEVIAISIATGVIKTIMVTILTPIIAKRIGLDNPHTAMVYGGLIGTTSGVAAGLAATDPKLIPYGALTATFYTGLGCLLCPSLLYFLVKAVVG